MRAREEAVAARRSLSMRWRAVILRERVAEEGSRPAILSSRRFCSSTTRLVSSSCSSRFLRSSFLPLRAARRTLASCSSPFSSWSRSSASGLALLVSGCGSISPGLIRLGSKEESANFTPWALSRSAL